MYESKSCIAYLAGLTDIAGKGFNSICEVKTSSVINACQENPDRHNDSFLVLGENVIPFGLTNNNQVTVIDGLKSYGSYKCNANHHDGELADFVAQGQSFDWVVAPNEWITYADSEEQQKQMLSMISKITRKGFFTTIKDYKNMYANQRYFEEPFVLRSNSGDAIIIRKREWDTVDKQAWEQQNYIIHGDKLVICPKHNRRTMYFKQLAKFTSDLGATSFSVEKQNMYKPIFSKTFEYVICIKF